VPAAYAIVEDRGTQIKVSAGDVLDIDLHPDASPADESKGGKSKSKTKKAAKLTFDRVLAIGDTASEKAATIGTPYIEGATVTADVLEEVRGEKLDVIMYKRRKGQRRKIGHRQSFLRIKIDKISA
jgi:large subunit ribosomal protein L21